MMSKRQLRRAWHRHPILSTHVPFGRFGTSSNDLAKHMAWHWQRAQAKDKGERQAPCNFTFSARPLWTNLP